MKKKINNPFKLKQNKNMFSIWKPMKPTYKRTPIERKLIRRNPWGDKDHDLVPNWIDCKPFDRMKQGKRKYKTPEEAQEIRKAYTISYEQIPEVREKYREYSARYRKSPKYRKKQESGKLAKYQRQYLMNHPEQKEKIKIYLTNPKYIEYRKKYQQTPEFKEARKKHYQTPKYKETRKKYYEENKEKINEYNKKYQPEYQTRKARVMTSILTIPEELKQDIKKYEEEKILENPRKIIIPNEYENENTISKSNENEPLTEIKTIRTTQEKYDWMKEHNITPTQVFREALHKLKKQVEESELDENKNLIPDKYETDETTDED